MQSHGYSQFRPKGHYLISNAIEEERDAAHIGQIRVTFEYDRCSEATLIAQQTTDQKMEYTFTEWNPKKIDAKASGKQDEGDNEISVCGMACCYMCMCVTGCFNTMFEEIVDFAGDGCMSAETFFKKQERTLKWSTLGFRFMGVFLAVMGLYMIFTPVILLLKWIPLVGFLLGGITSLAAAIFALVIGLTMSLLVMSVAWLLFRPLVALSLLALGGVGVYLTLFWDGSIPGVL